MVLARGLSIIALLLTLAASAFAQDSPIAPATATGTLTSTTCTGTPGTGTGCLVLSVSGYASLSAQVTGIGSATLQFEVSNDGVTYSALNLTPPGTTTAVTSTTANGLWVGSVGGLKYARVRASVYGSGSIVVTLQAAQSGGGGGGGGGGAASSVTINDPSITTQKAAVNASGQLSITCANCSGSGASAVDNSAFTAGATSGAPAMGFFHTTIDTVTDGDTATVAIDSKRSQFGVIRDAALNARGANVTAGNALLVDASATTQPVSGSFFQATQPVSLAVLPALVAGSAVIGHVLADTGSTTAVTQATGTNLHAVLDTTSTTAVTQATGTNLHAVLDTTSTTAVTQATATNLNAAVVGTGTAGSPAGNILTIQGVGSMTKLLVTPDSVALPANQSTNVAQLAGTATSVNSGTKDAGTLRVVLATDQPALTNKLLVTPDSVALPANQSVNVAQMNGVATTMGAGATGTGVQRTNDVGTSATGAAPPASAHYVGGLISGATGGFLGGFAACDLSKVVNMSTATTTLMVTGVAGRQVRICSFHLVTTLANNVAWLEGTGATCGTGTAGMAGGTTAASGYNFAANGGIALGSGLGEVLRTATTGDSVCLITSAATQLSGFINYTIY